MLVERVAVCWLQLHHIDTLAPRQVADEKQAQHWSQLQGQADRRYHAALQQLMTVQRLGGEAQRREPPRATA